MATPAISATTLGVRRIIGTAAFVSAGLALKSTSRRKNPVDGESRVYTYVGTQAAVLNSYATINLTDYLEVEIDESGDPEFRLIVNAPDDSAVNAVTNYELITNELTKDIWESERSTALSADVIRDIRKRVDLRSDGSGLSGDALKLYKAASLGVTTFDYFQFVYRCTKVVARNYTEKIATSNRGKVYKTTQVLNETQPPPGLVFSLSEVQWDSSAGGPNDVAESSTDNGTIYGWRKSSIEVRRVAGYRIAVTTEFKTVKALTFTYQSA